MTVLQGRDGVDPAALAAQIRLYRSAILAGTSQNAARSGALPGNHDQPSTTPLGMRRVQAGLLIRSLWAAGSLRVFALLGGGGSGWLRSPRLPGCCRRDRFVAAILFLLDGLAGPTAYRPSFKLS